MRVSAGTRAGRSHRVRDVPCQDSFAVWRSPDGGRVAAAVADGLGSKPLSHFGSQAACAAAVASLAAEPAAWDEAALRRAFEAGHAAVRAAAAERGLAVDELTTTLQVAGLDEATGQAVAGMVGDGAIVAHEAAAVVGVGIGVGSSVGVGVGTGVSVLLAPPEGGYANEVFPLTSDGWQDHLRLASRDGVRSVLLFTDGLTRLLLSKSKAGWQPFSPFFEAFLPRLEPDAFDERVVEGFLAGDEVDRSWDDDKGLVVMSGG